MSTAVETRDAYLTVSEVAKRLQVSRATIYRLIGNAQLPAFQLGGPVDVEHPERYSAADLATVCEGCLLERHPGLRRAMEIAREWEKRSWSTESGKPPEPCLALAPGSSAAIPSSTSGSAAF